MWGPPPANLMLASDEVHVWCASLEQSPALVEQLAQTLSKDERTRAARFYFEQHKNRFIVGRGILRTLLGSYLSIEPTSVQFCYGPRGKPALSEICSKAKLCFNVSHSQGLALYAVTRDRQIGVDIEQIRPIPNAEEIALRFFSPREHAVISDLPPNQKQKAFFNCWTRKEAYIKAIGEGLAHSLDQIEVTLAPGERANLLSIAGSSQEACRWSLHELVPVPADEYASALVVEGNTSSLSCWQWSE